MVTISEDLGEQVISQIREFIEALERKTKSSSEEKVLKENADQ